jgi:hypothetical protein
VCESGGERERERGGERGEIMRVRNSEFTLFFDLSCHQHTLSHMRSHTCCTYVRMCSHATSFVFHSPSVTNPATFISTTFSRWCKKRREKVADDRRPHFFYLASRSFFPVAALLANRCFHYLPVFVAWIEVRARPVPRPVSRRKQHCRRANGETLWSSGSHENADQKVRHTSPKIGGAAINVF